MKIEVQNISVAYEQDLVLKNVDFSLQSGEMVAIIGPNGSGKSTLLKSLLGILNPQKGKILIENQSPQAFLSKNKGKIAYLPQQHQLNPLLPLSVYDVISQSLKARKKWIERLTESEKIQIQEVMDLFQITQSKDELFINLSGGQRQKVLLAATLVTQPEFLFLDEPTNTLDSLSIQHLYQILTDLVKKGLGILIISHDISAIVTHSHKIGVLQHELLYYGTPTESQEPLIHKVFGTHITFNSCKVDCDTCAVFSQNI